MGIVELEQNRGTVFATENQILSTHKGGYKVNSTSPWVEYDLGLPRQTFFRVGTAKEGSSSIFIYAPADGKESTIVYYAYGINTPLLGPMNRNELQNQLKDVKLL